MRTSLIPTLSRRRNALPAAWLGIFAMVAFPALLAAQTSAKPGSSVLNAIQKLQSAGPAANGLPPDWVEQEPPALEAPVDPARYQVLPGDRLHLGIWGEIPLAHYLAVGPEGDLIVPSVGPVRIAGRSLKEAEAILTSALRMYYPGDRVTLRLIQPGKFRISITGMVGHPGIYEVTGFDRISSAIEMAGGVRPGGSIRRIQIYRTADSASVAQDSEIDLLPWTLRGDKKADPVVEPGLAIEVPSQGETVRIRGPVNGRSAIEIPTATPVRIGDRPEEEPDMVLEWRKGDSVSDLLDQVGGLSERATGSGILHREGEPNRVLDLRSQTDRETELRAGDMIEVTYAARWVFVVGSVRAPGRYPYLPGLTARDYVFMAGGPTELGRSTGWTVQLPNDVPKDLERSHEVLPGWTIRVPERRTYKLSTLLGPLSSATALVISLVALTRSH